MNLRAGSGRDREALALRPPPGTQPPAPAGATPPSGDPLGTEPRRVLWKRPCPWGYTRRRAVSLDFPAIFCREPATFVYVRVRIHIYLLERD